MLNLIKHKKAEKTEEKAENVEITEEPVLSEKSMSLIYQFFCWCSGARLYLLRKCPTDYNVFFGIGVVIFLTGLLAFMSGSYAFYTVFASEKLSLAFGFFWGVLIFFLDWYLVSSFKKQGMIGKELLMSVPRFVFAMFLGVVISKPVELKLFEPEIKSKIESLNIDETLGNKSKILQEYNEIEDLKQANETFAIQLKQKEMQRNKLFELVIAEAEGTSGTGLAGKGSVYREKKEAFDKVNSELDELKKSLQPVIEKNVNRVEQLIAQRDAAMARTAETVQSSTGFLARLDALEKLSKNNRTIRWTSWFITLLFICIESAPIFVKLISSRSAYDELIEAESMKKKSVAQQELFKIKYANDVRFEIDAELAEMQKQVSLDLKAEFVKDIKEAKKTLNRQIVEKWKENEEERISKNMADFLPDIQTVINGPDARNEDLENLNSDNTTNKQQHGASK